MERLTHERVNGIKTGYWSAATKEVLVQKLAAYENTGYEPDEIRAAIEQAAKNSETKTATIIDADGAALVVRGQLDGEGDLALGRGLRVGVENVLDHLVHLIVDALLEGAAGHRHDAVALVLFVHGVSPRWCRRCPAK